MSKFILINGKEVRAPKRPIKFKHITNSEDTLNARKKVVSEIIGEDEIVFSNNIEWELLSAEEYKEIQAELDRKSITLTFYDGNNGRVTLPYKVDEYEAEPLLADDLGNVTIYRNLVVKVRQVEQD